MIKRFVVVLYDKSSFASKVNAARRELLTKKGDPLESIPPKQVCKFDVEYESFEDQVSTQVSQSNSSFSRTLFYITLIEKRTKRSSG